MKYPYYDKCSCPESEYWQAEARKYKNIVELMNDGKPVDLEGFDQGNTYVLMPVGIAKYKQIKKEHSRQESWLRALSIWLRNSDDKVKELKRQLKEK
jgi:hypothetical protein